MHYSKYMKSLTGVLLLAATVVSPSHTALAEAATSQDSVAENKQPNMKDLLNQVNDTAKGLQESIDSFSESIAQAKDSEAAGKKLLDEMEATIQTINGRMNMDSDIWQQLNALLKEWEKNKQAALDKSESAPAFKEIAAKWGERIDKATALGQSIREQAAESGTMLDALKERRDLILAQYQLGDAEAVLAAMTKINDNFTKLNDGMKGIVEKTEEVTGQQVAQ